MGDLGIAGHYASSLDVSWLAEPYPYPARRGMIASADSDLPPEKIPFLESQGAIAADWESAALAWVAQRNNVPLLILRAVSDMVSVRGGEVYDNLEKFNQRAKEIMEELIGQLPDWLDHIRL
jgi:nucleoside phosphorylase